ncbi:MAG TPA: DedA family protein [Rhodopirellula sp.]|nr:DedA family protein [Rhodopirellula sp.]
MFRAPPPMQAIVIVNQRTGGRYISLRFLVPLALITCGLSLVMSGFQFSDLRHQLERHGEWTPVLFMLCGVAAMTVLVPKTAVSLSAGAIFGTLTGGVLMLFIAVIAASLNYCIARWWLHEAICTKLAREQQNPSFHRLHTIRSLAADAGFLFHLMVRLTPIPTTLISYTMGASGSRLAPFLLAAAVAVVPQLLWVQSGASAAIIANGSASTIHWIVVITSVAAAILTSILVPKLALRQNKLVK